jgi:hypothetical protein
MKGVEANMNTDVLVRDLEGTGLTLGAYVYLKATKEIDREDRENNKKRRGSRTKLRPEAERVKNLMEELQEEGLDGKEIKKRVWKELNNQYPNKGFIGITPEIKEKIRTNLEKSKLIDTLIIPITDEIIEELDVEVAYDDTNEDVSVKLASVDFRPFFNLEIARNERFNCFLLEGNTAWFSQDAQTKIYRYFSQDKEKRTYALNFFDMVEVVYQKEFIFALKFVAQELKLKYKEVEWLQTQLDKYNQNIMWLEMADTRIKKEFPILYKYSKNYFSILIKLQNIAIKNLMSMKYSVDDESIFFSSARFLQAYKPDLTDALDRTKSKDGSKASRAINVFTVLGMVNKIKDKGIIPDFLFEKAKLEMGEKGQHNMINFYTIPVYDSVLLQRAEYIVNTLREHNVGNKDITFDTINTVFGIEKATEIYGGENVGAKFKELKRQARALLSPEEIASMQNFQATYIEEDIPSYA